MLEKLMGNPIAWAILSLLTIFSTIFALYTWIAGKKQKQFSVSCRTNEIIIAGKSNIDKLQIRYDDHSITDLSCTKFYVWNSGNTVINSSDIVSSRPICIKNTGSAVILNAEIVRVSDETNGFVINNATEQSAEVSFDYVDHGEGFVMQILHSGTSKDLEMDCKVKGGSEVKDRSYANRKRKESTADKLIDTICTWIPPAFGFALLFVGILLGTEIANSSINPWLGVPLSVIIMFGPAIFGVWGGYKLMLSINQKTHRAIPYSLTK